MALDQEIDAARNEIISDGYVMSIGEVLNLYREKELIIHPAFQRLFRWDKTQKTRFIESLLLGIPIPPICVVQTEQGVWELIDGLQRLSTVLEFSGQLLDSKREPVPALTLGGTKLLPSLSGKRWGSSEDEQVDDGIGKIQQLRIKRARLRVEILRNQSDATAKYGLFQRLNAGGAYLTRQEVRSCVAEMVNPHFYMWLRDLSKRPDFVCATARAENALEQKTGVELVLRFLALRSTPYRIGLDVHEYLDVALLGIAADANYPRDAEQEVFDLTFSWLRQSMGADAFKKWNQNGASGTFLVSVFEVVAIGVSKNVDSLRKLSGAERNAFLKDRVGRLWADQDFLNHTGEGVLETTSLDSLLLLGQRFFEK